MYTHEIYRSTGPQADESLSPNGLKQSKIQKTQTRIEARLNSIKYGNFGDCQSVGDGVFESRLHFGPGYRIYFGVVDNAIVLLLCGGDKSSQARDIVRAKAYWLEYKEAQG